MDVPHESLVKLNGIDREARQLRQGRVPRTKVIQVNLRSQAAKLLDH